jgi:hypothetical protein
MGFFVNSAVHFTGQGKQDKQCATHGRGSWIGNHHHCGHAGPELLSGDLC